jgi:hypothetical protein
MADAVVRTDRGAVRGVVGDDVACFRGIPFASAPEGPLRFLPPVPAAAWDGVRDAVEFGTAPPQASPAPGVPSAWRPADGLDCLTLNVWSPDLGAAGLPVTVWIYGGMWKIGSSGMPQYDAAALARAGVVAVTVNYWVGFEGFGHLPGVPDNRSLRDQFAALEWVQRNIAAFGGDPGTVTVLASPRARPRLCSWPPRQPPGACSAGRSRRACRTATGPPPRPGGLPGSWLPRPGWRPPGRGSPGWHPRRSSRCRTRRWPATGLAASPSFGQVIDGDLVTGPPWTALRAGARRQHRPSAVGTRPASARGVVAR